MQRIPLLLPAIVLALLLSPCGFAQTGKVLENVPYKTGDSLSQPERERCRLDLYLPSGRGRDFSTLVWFHGGGLTGGSKDDETSKKIARRLAREGIAVAVPNYRLSPGATFPSYIEDAAAAVAWVHTHIAEHGGDPAKLFVGGHSAGGYLTSMVGMDLRYLQNAGVDPANVIGLIPMSGQMVTHFTVKKERGIGEHTIIADEAAPIHFTRKETPPFLIIFGDRDWPGRLEENQYFAAAQRAAGNENVTILVVNDRDHNSIADRTGDAGDPAGKAIVDFIRRHSVPRTR